MRREIGIAAVALLVGGAALVAIQACVDGTTADCTSPDAQCGPSNVAEDVAVPTDAKADVAIDASDAAVASDATADAGEAAAADASDAASE